MESATGAARVEQPFVRVAVTIVVFAVTDFHRRRALDLVAVQSGPSFGAAAFVARTVAGVADGRTVGEQRDGSRCALGTIFVPAGPSFFKI